MLVYLDLCCLKRPFDRQDHPLVHLETVAVQALLAAEPERVRFVRSASHVLENSYNPIRARREGVADWLDQEPLTVVTVNELRARAMALYPLGFSKFDGLHLASAELAQAEVFVTVDYSLLRRARAQASLLNVRITEPVRFAEEVYGGATDRQS